MNAALAAAWCAAAVFAAAACASRRPPIERFESVSRRALERAGFARRTALTPSGPLTYFEGGAGAPTLVLLHGAGDQAGNWSAVAPALAQRFRVVVPDLPGHGDSPPRDGPLPMDVVVDGAAALLASRPAGERVVVVGNSFGAWLAMVLAERAPGRVVGVVLVNGGGMLGEGPPPNLVPATREDARRLMDAMTDPASPRVSDAVLDDMVRRAPNGGIARMGVAGLSMFPFLFDAARLARFPVRAELLWGASDRVVPLSYAQAMARALPDARLTTLERCGHVPQRECPERFTAALVALVEEAP